MRITWTYWLAVASAPVVILGALSPWAAVGGVRVDGILDEVALGLGIVGLVSLGVYGVYHRWWLAFAGLLVGLTVGLLAGAVLRNVDDFVAAVDGQTATPQWGLDVTLVASSILALASLVLLGQARATAGTGWSGLLALPGQRRPIDRAGSSTRRGSRRALYEDKWGNIEDRVAAVIDAGEHDLCRVMRLVEGDWRSMNRKPVRAPVLGEVVRLPRALLVGGRRNLITRILMESTTPETSMVVELGAGYGQNLFDLYLGGGPKTRYYALELTERGRACAELLAGLAPDFDLTTQPFDFERPRYQLPTDNEHVLVLTCHAIEQVTELPEEALTGLFALGRSVTVVHFEPIDWQLGSGAIAEATAKRSAKKAYNRNLWPLLTQLQDRGEIEIDQVVQDIVGFKTTNASTLVTWHRGNPQ